MSGRIPVKLMALQKPIGHSGPHCRHGAGTACSNKILEILVRKTHTTACKPDAWCQIRTNIGGLRLGHAGNRCYVPHRYWMRKHRKSRGETVERLVPPCFLAGIIQLDSEHIAQNRSEEPSGGKEWR